MATPKFSTTFTTCVALFGILLMTCGWVQLAYSAGPDEVHPSPNLLSDLDSMLVDDVAQLKSKIRSLEVENSQLKANLATYQAAEVPLLQELDAKDKEILSLKTRLAVCSCPSNQVPSLADSNARKVKGAVVVSNLGKYKQPECTQYVLESLTSCIISLFLQAAENWDTASAPKNGQHFARRKATGRSV